MPANSSPHTDIRTYTFSESSANPAGFALKLLENVYTEQSKESERPHRHDYYAIIFIEEGYGIHYVDFNEYKVENKSIFFILPGQMHQLLFFHPPKGRIVLFTEEFLMTNGISEKMINDIYLFNEYGVSPPMSINESQMSVYLKLFEQMDYFSQSIQNYTTEALGSLLRLFLIQSNNHCSLLKNDNLQLTESGNHLLRSFKHLLNKNFASSHMVSDYAAEMAVTADYLNKSVKSVTGKSAKDHILSKLMIEAKRALTFSSVSNKELSFALGFEEPAHFNNFFKKMTGITPSEFRISAHQS
jgi:AraC family transcriptional regulator, transcriptional activator of pobA